MFIRVCNHPNAVGYNTLNLGFAHQIMGISFQGVGDTNGEEGVMLEDIKGSFSSYDELQFSFDEPSGLINFNVYQYLTESDGVEKDGWYDESWEYVGDKVKIPLGSAVWLNSNATDTTISGEVAHGEKKFTFDKVHNMVCAAYPVPFNPNEDRFTWDGVLSYDEIQISYDEPSGLINFNVWQYLTESDGVEKDGWHDDSWEPVTEPIATVGQGYWLNLADYENVTVTEKAPAGL